jgi:hypothetical protein
VTVEIELAGYYEHFERFVEKVPDTPEQESAQAAGP